eukprot:CAMPEP_0174969054 /NCGR_PEP_ID=MMETSP0004_2-20121128/8513_1 /TAXON_ID=420556 /ORGANISM="Ochromonas sp., Strain CCMP1393" /LENGTH=125 /DNA_ID=CAMNT_0016218429 /DNA_START=91 /DNA_END=470 /DNA_ORIENTATION=-
MAAARALVGHFHMSTQATEELKRRQPALTIRPDGISCGGHPRRNNEMVVDLPDDEPLVRLKHYIGTMEQDNLITCNLNDDNGKYYTRLTTFFISKARAALKPENAAAIVFLHDSWELTDEYLNNA